MFVRIIRNKMKRKDGGEEEKEKVELEKLWTCESKQLDGLNEFTSSIEEEEKKLSYYNKRLSCIMTFISFHFHFTCWFVCQ